MAGDPVRDAIAQVRELQQAVLESRRFRGYSGRARALGGTLALTAAFVMSRGVYPRTHIAHVIGWSAVAAVAVLLNFGAVVLWHLTGNRERPDIRRLMPMLDPLPALFVGGVLTAVMIRGGHYDHLFGMWMCLFGVANFSARLFLPRTQLGAGLFYVACGTVCLLAPGVTFVDPWPMGIVFFVGEWAGGFLFFFNRYPNATFADFFCFWRPVR